MGKFHLGHSCPSTWFVKYPSTHFIVIWLWMTFIRQQSTQLLHLWYTVTAGRRVKFTTYINENHLWLLHNVLCNILMVGQSNINITLIFISMWRLDKSLSMICEMWSSIYSHYNLFALMISHFTLKLDYKCFKNNVLVFNGVSQLSHT